MCEIRVGPRLDLTIVHAAHDVDTATTRPLNIDPDLP
jgi:hypothetical protein